MFSLVKLPPVFNAHQVPKAFQEDSIISGYRHPRSSATDCILSLFQLTNETLNVWTHFLPTWYFLYKLVTVIFLQDVWTDSYTWPLLVYLVSCCVYPLASSCAHTFSTMSTRSRHICYFFDYGALSLYSLGSAIAYSAYIVPDAWVNSNFHKYYVPVAVLNTVISTATACYSRLGFLLHSNHDSVNRFAENKRPRLGKVLRVLAFTYPYLFDNIPLFYRIFFCVGEGCTANEVNPFHVHHIILAFLTGFLFATHLPERLAPGRFDLIGHSHQLFHVCGITATHFQMQALEMDMTLRRKWLHVNAPAVTFGGTLGASMVSIMIGLGIIYYFSYPLFYRYVVQQSGRKGSGKVKKN
ncbi:membrane progestin receptor gamma-B isoform X1 [Clarias gariepinus]|uniref:membrane progestin receptor gamma-B isoform X1 n=1 Tax=Clarias gariepinus TaxID=13013 RepID=UPI00234DDC8C|nr:membrane progestin receptor gamma-B isoform X1 [Clarias gariepinus]